MDRKLSIHELSDQQKQGLAKTDVFVKGNLDEYTEFINLNGYTNPLDIYYGVDNRVQGMLTDWDKQTDCDRDTEQTDSVVE